MSATPPNEHQPGALKLPARDNLVIWLLLVAAFVMILNETIMGVALPELMSDLGITAGTGQWLTTAYLLTMAVIIPITGMLIIRIPTRTLFIAATTLFTAGTLLAGVAPGFELLLVGRVVQASGTAVMMPLLMTTVMTLVPAGIRGKIMGRISIVMSVAPALGPTVSGLILQRFEWRMLFLFVLPIAIAVLILGALKMKNVTETRRARIDVFSVVLSAFGFGGLVFGLSAIGESVAGHAPVNPLIPIAVGALGVGLFIWRQFVLQRTDDALLDLRTFRSTTFSLAVVLLSISMMALFGTLILLPIFVQSVLGLDTLSTGLMLLPGGLLMGLLGPVVGNLFDRVGARPLLIPGVGIVALSLWCMALFINEGTSILLITAMHIMLSLGLSLTFTPLFTLSLGALPKKLYSYGSATISTAQQIAGAAGTAIFVTLMTVGSADRLAQGASETAAMAGGIHTAFLCGAVLATLAFGVSWFLRESEPVDDASGDGASGEGAAPLH